MAGGSGSGDSSSVVKGGGKDLSRETGQVKAGDVEAKKRSFNLRASPIHVAPLLARAFEAHAGPIVFTSATLTATLRAISL